MNGTTWYWAHKGCEVNHYLFEFKKKEGDMIIHFKNPIDWQDKKVTKLRYKIKSVFKDGFRSRIAGEHRLDDNGDPVQWDLILNREKQTLHWRRNDWPQSSLTKPIIRCE